MAFSQMSAMCRPSLLNILPFIKLLLCLGSACFANSEEALNAWWRFSRLRAQLSSLVSQAFLNWGFAIKHAQGSIQSKTERDRHPWAVLRCDRNNNPRCEKFQLVCTGPNGQKVSLSAVFYSEGGKVT